MSTFTITISGDRPLRNVIREMEGKVKAPRAALKRVGDRIVRFSKDNMKSEGVKLLKKQWKKLSPQTLIAKRRLGFGGKKILERTGKLRGGIRVISLKKNEVVVGNKINYYKFHQLGGKKIPKRQMLGVNNEVTKIVVDELAKSIRFK